MSLRVISVKTTKSGWIAAGQFPDFAVLSEDFFSVPPEHIRGIESLLTVVGGTPVHAAGVFAPHALPPIPILQEWSPIARFGGHWRVSANGSLPPEPVVCAHGFSCAPLGDDALNRSGGDCSCWAY
ncbi:MAG: hypothetical protein IT435_15125 [Phycisphaerales bacterium]|nr:hypothetical protein [Phycisphaerales bacterium]